jgi:hypothetical protein
LVSHYITLSKPKKSAVYSKYWDFSVKRNQIFLNRLTNAYGPWTTDSILSNYKFTNVFRASDRVSQYLINLQYESDQDVKEVFFKTLLFKIFNKIETYKYLELELAEVSYKSFSLNSYDRLLTFRMAQGYPIYSAAYIMPSAGSTFGHKLKHTNHLALLEKMMREKVYEKIQNSKSLKDIYNILLSYPSFGSFLAFQYTIDLNYSSIINFSERDFVVAGPGAKNGILKCFDDLGDYSFEDIIKFMTDNQELECENYGLTAPKLMSRSLQLIDCQNLFCEVDKYLRVSNPELSVASGKVRIKQKYVHSLKENIDYFFPPDWNINDQFNILCQQKVNANIFS